MLVVLVQNRGRLVDKDELLSKVWPGTVVEEANLSQGIFTLRKILGDSPKDPRYIATIAGRGYQFVAPVTELTRGTQEPTPQSHKTLAIAVIAAAIAGHPGRGRVRRASRQGRHRGLLLGRPAGLAFGRESARTVGGGCLLRRRHDGRQRAIAQARGADDGALRRPGCAHLGREREGVRAGARRKWRFICTRPITASTAISAAPTTPPPRQPRSNARCTTSASTSAESARGAQGGEFRESV